MVKIINGEIVQDNDPRLIQRKSGSVQPASVPTSRVTSLGSESRIPPTPQTPHQTMYPQGHEQPGNPIDIAARALGIHENFITIPAIPALNFTSSKIGLIYVILVLLLVMIFGLRALLFAIICFGLYKHSQK